jgi:integrase
VETAKIQKFAENTEFIPTEQEIDQLKAGCGRKTATILQVIKETGMRIGECLSLTWSCVSPEAHTITLNTPEKNSLPRLFKVSSKLIGMLQTLPNKHEKIFGVTRSKGASINLSRQRQRIAKKNRESTNSEDSFPSDTPLERHNGIP